MIEPTVGRVVWYHPGAAEYDHIPAPPLEGHALAAHVASVRADGTINLMVIDANGGTFARLGVHLVQDGETTAVGMPYAEWMPYQKGQAAKAEALQAQIEQKPPTPQPPAEAAQQQPQPDPAPTAAVPASIAPAG